MSSPIRVAADVARALKNGKPVVALESSVLAQGLPIPQNRAAAQRMNAAVENAGALPAITAVVKGVPALGIEEDELERFLRREGVRKVSARDLPAAIAAGVDGATTVAATLAIGGLAGAQVFATGGIGGVHRDAPYDESADLLELSRTRMIVVCAGAKSILDLPATWERLETLGVPVVGYRTDELPGFFTTRTGIRLETSTSEPSDIVKIWRAHCSLGRPQSLLVVQPPPEAFALDAEAVEEAVTRAQAEARREGVTGARVTPYLLGAVTRLTGGTSLDANLALLERNASLAGEIATLCVDAATG
jgi:pseudouridine-5'-phosphate glycosidase